MFTLSNLPKNKDKTKNRIGRGNASSGTYSGRGQKGQRSRSGGKSGLTRLASRDWVQKLPKMRGFKSIHNKPSWVDVSTLVDRCGDIKVITPGLLKKHGIIDSVANGVKILGNSPIKKALHVKGFYISASAKEVIESAGGKVEDIVVARTIRKAEAKKVLEQEKQAAREAKKQS